MKKPVLKVTTTIPPVTRTPDSSRRQAAERRVCGVPVSHQGVPSTTSSGKARHQLA